MKETLDGSKAKDNTQNVLVEQSEPVKEESQSKLWDEVFKVFDEHEFSSRLKPELLSKFHLTRSGINGQR